MHIVSIGLDRLIESESHTRKTSKATEQIREVNH